MVEVSNATHLGFRVLFCFFGGDGERLSAHYGSDLARPGSMAHSDTH